MSIRSADQPTMLQVERAASYVYLLPLMDLGAFKIGMTKQPLQRIHTFNPRYFERFDLHAARLLSVTKHSRARSIEASLKTAFATQRTDAPLWVNDNAGGDTEWFRASEYALAAENLDAFVEEGGAGVHNGFEYLRAHLIDSRSAFEYWAVQEAELLREDAFAVSLGHDPRVRINTLRDWLDAYRYFAIELFDDDAEILTKIRESANLKRLVG